MIARPLPFTKGFDTSEDLTQRHYAALAGLSYECGVRYVPRAGMSPTTPGVIQKAELDVALATPLTGGRTMGMMFVQFGRTSGWSITTGLADGEAAAQHVLSVLGAPNIVSVWGDFDIIPTATLAEDFVNSWYEGTIKGGLAPSAAGGYFEPGFVLNAQDRYKKLNFHRYWACQSDDPERMVAHRGCQIIQAFVAPRGEFSPIAGLLIDGDMMQSDYFGDAAVAVFAG